MGLELYINGQVVDLTDTLDLNYTYQTTDVTKPDIVKNSFSKTISLKGTKQNNKIFGSIYQFDNIMFNFDATEKTPAVITLNGDIIESGYIELNSIDRQPNGDIKYNITFYGGLGDFFYNLSYDEEGNEKTLADIRFFLTDDNGLLIENPADEMDFNINKEFVYDIWNRESFYGEDKLKGIINFIPCYNGLPDGDFNADKCVINTTNQSVFPTSATNEGTTYRTIDGYALASLENDYTEWQMCDLRSYLQRPAIKLSKVIESICRPENNGGYEVKLDDSFFNSHNPYWSNTWIGLPMLNTSLGEIEMTGGTIKLPYYNGTPTSSNRNDLMINLRENNSRDYIDMSSYEGYNKLNLQIPVSLTASNNFEAGSNCYTSWGYGSGNYYLGAIGLQLVVENTNGVAINGSPVYLFGNRASDSIRNYVDQNSTKNYLNSSTMYNFTPKWKGGYTNIMGYFTWSSSLNKFIFEQALTFDNTFVLELECDVPSNFVVKLYRYYIVNQNMNTLIGSWGNNIRFGNRIYDGGSNNQFAQATTDVGPTNFTNGQIIVTPKDSAASNIKITKRILLSPDITPAQWLLSYCKMFGLYFVKDKYTKTINILNRNNYYRNNIVDLEYAVDYNKAINIDPLYFENKWLNFELPTPETTIAKRYKSLYGSEYGSKKHNTNYNFNADKEDLFEDNVYQNIITGVDSNRLYRVYKTATGQDAPSFLIDNCNYTLYATNDEYEQPIYGAEKIRKVNTVEWNEYTAGADIYPKPFCYSGDNELEEFKASLFFYNYNVDAETSSGQKIDFCLTDDLPVMFRMGVLPCWIWSKSNDVIHLYSLPMFTRYNNILNIDAGLDFGKPKEIYIDGNYLDDAPLYDKYWKSYYTDLTNKNTKKVTAYVKFNRPVEQEMLRDFYTFGNCLWVLNKVDVNYLSTDTCKCEFLKVTSIDAYLDGQEVTPYIKAEDYYLIPWTGGTQTIYFYSNDPSFTITYSADYFTNYSIEKTDVPNQWKITFTAKQSTTPYTDPQYSMTVSGSTGISRSLGIRYDVDYDRMTYVYGTCTRAIDGVMVYFTFDGARHSNYAPLRKTTAPQEYKIFIPKNQDVTLYDYDSNTITVILGRSTPLKYDIK